jgi:hypothetical protein
MNDDITNGTPLRPEEEFWMEKMRQVAADSIKSVEEAAKQLVGMITVMEGIYAAVLAFSGIKEVPKGSIIGVAFYALPIALWLVSLFFALRVFKSRRYRYYSNSPDSASETFQKIADFKYKNLNAAYAFICISFLVALGGIMYWLYR